ncbi:GntR family transcriptional regulator [Streptomyces sp. TRM S81-3]|uniref:GntR family transcriptional regulator n=1 Tax=Streptomyces griseicoloratus TaxID=2752516 RepID=A0A926QV46_9ACTN|nr:GntR family transcriptional regulator [Streptomyces griseicoloratus]MBD0424630.1 GntR family transcriptional regulator [Streptomyces griseicoloratus]
MVAKGGKQTLSDDVRARLRADILSGRLLPGYRLKFPELGTRYDASVSVLREALVRLAEQGLVRSEPHQGFVVTPLSREQLWELTEARVELETLVLRRSVVEGDLAWESRLVAAHHTLERTPYTAEGDDQRVDDDWATAHAAFHEALLAGCTNQRLLRMALGLRDEAELYRRWSQPLGDEPGRDLTGEHRALLEAALTRDPDAAAAALCAHVRHTTELLLAAADRLDHDHSEAQE